MNEMKYRLTIKPYKGKKASVEVEDELNLVALLKDGDFTRVRWYKVEKL